MRPRRYSCIRSCAGRAEQLLKFRLPGARFVVAEVYVRRRDPGPVAVRKNKKCTLRGGRVRPEMCVIMLIHTLAGCSLFSSFVRFYNWLPVPSMRSALHLASTCRAHSTIAY